MTNNEFNMYGIMKMIKELHEAVCEITRRDAEGTVRCPDCGSSNIVKRGYSKKGANNFGCLNESCDRRIFIVK